MNEGAVFEALKTRYKSPEHVLLPQVRSRTGFSGNIRTADAIAVGLWPSRGITISGFEIKTRRGDWLNELRDPAKSCEIQQYCDEWWIVTPKQVPDIIQDGELPVTWGHMEVSVTGYSKTRAIKAAPKLEAAQLNKNFLAAILRQVDGYVAPLEALEAAYKRGYKEGKDKECNDNNFEIKNLEKQRDNLKRVVDEFERASGLSIKYNNETTRVGEALRLFMDKGEHVRMGKELEKLLINAKSIAAFIEKGLVDLNSAKTEVGPCLTTAQSD